jgi:hypothetical protein
VVRQNPQGLGVFVDYTSTDVPDAGADLLGGHDPQLAALELFD